MSQQTESAIRFAATVSSIDASTIVRLPDEASARLPSRGQVAVRASVNGHEFRTVLEPDGFRGHWMHIDKDLQRAAGVGDGDNITLAITATPEWPEADVPADLAAALAAAPSRIRAMWEDITPMARWEWVRWVNATANPSTRERRIDVSISKMHASKRRPCCFDLSSCTDVAVSKNGKLRGSP